MILLVIVTKQALQQHTVCLSLLTHSQHFNHYSEAGTFGRVVGDFIISAAGLVGLERILDLTFTPIALLVSLTLLATWKLYPHLEPDDEDE
jgi:hypothetical protein